MTADHLLQYSCFFPADKPFGDDGRRGRALNRSNEKRNRLLGIFGNS